MGNIKKFNKNSQSQLLLLPPPLSKEVMDTQKTLTKCSQTKNPSTKTTGLDTRKLDNLWLIATSMNLRTGSERENASTPGNAEVPEFAKDKDGAMVMMPARKFTSENIHWRENSSMSLSLS